MDTETNRNLIENMNVYIDEDQCWVVVETGRPETHVALGKGPTLREAYDDLEATPVQCCGWDSGLAAGLDWAASSGWLCGDAAALIPRTKEELYGETPAETYDDDEEELYDEG